MRGGGGWGRVGAAKMKWGGRDGFPQDKEIARGDGGVICCQRKMRDEVFCGGGWGDAQNQAIVLQGCVVSEVVRNLPGGVSQATSYSYVGFILGWRLSVSPQRRNLVP